MFRLLSTPIIRSTLTVSAAAGTGHTSVQLPSSNVAEFKLGHVVSDNEKHELKGFETKW